MGTDNLHHKRKTKQPEQLRRKKAYREPYAKILIVCEGAKTEPNYFEGTREYFKLHSVNVEITGEECSSDPLSVVEYAKQRFEAAKKARAPFDQVFCVFDKDQHATYQAALDKIAAMQPKNPYVAINSVPCFEYWLLLYFTYSTSAYSPLPSNSVGNQVLHDLKIHLPEYEKGQNNIFSDLTGKLKNAKKHAERALQESECSGTDNPSTRVHKLIEVLENLAKPKPTD